MCAEPITVAGPCRILTGFRDASPAYSVVEEQPIEGSEGMSTVGQKKAVEAFRKS